MARHSFTEQGGITGRVRIVTRDLRTGHLIDDSGWSANTVTNGYLAALAGASLGQPMSPATQTELGTGTGTPAVTDTSLFTPDSATILTCSSLTLPASPINTAQWVSVYTGPAGAFTEVGLLAKDGTLYAHKMATVTITSGTQTTVTWQITLSAG